MTAARKDTVVENTRSLLKQSLFLHKEESREEKLEINRQTSRGRTEEEGSLADSDESERHQFASTDSIRLSKAGDRKGR